MRNLRKKADYLSYRVGLVFALMAILGGGISALVLIYAFRGRVAWHWPWIVLALFAGLGVVVYQWIYRPYQNIIKTMRLFSAGYTIDTLFALPQSISPEMDAVIEKIEEYLKTDQVLEASRRQAQYLALQNQINPHFLYNSLEGIRGEALVAGQTEIAEMTEALSTFFRYTISQVDHAVTLADELDSVRNYFFIQKFRFEDRFRLHIHLPEQAKSQALAALMPKLVLQPLVENAIVHGIEPKLGQGEVTVQVVLTQKKLLVTISDNGVGIPRERLKTIQQNLGKRSLSYVKEEGSKKSGIALINVNNRIKLIFGEEFGLELYSTEGVGTDVEVVLPYIIEEKEFHTSR